MELLKSQIFAIRNQEWLHSICPIPGRVDLGTLHNSIISEIKGNLGFWEKNFAQKSENHYRLLAYTSLEYEKELREQETIKKEEWENVRNEWELVEEKLAGSFSDHLIIIKNKKSGKIYKCRCNNYGGDNYWIELTER